MCKKFISMLLSLSAVLTLVSCALPPAAAPTPKRLLFIGNSATYVNDIPGTLSRLAQEAGYSIECDSITQGGACLTTFADPSTELGSNVLNTVKNGYDLVFLQDNGNCIESPETRLPSSSACKTLADEITNSGAEVGLCFRPPYGYEKWGYEPFEQCEQFDEHFLAISDTIHSSVNVFVNRAFALASEETIFNLWGDDNAHTSPYGAYLAVCVFFATLFDTSSAALEANGLPAEDARILQSIADRVALEGTFPF